LTLESGEIRSLSGDLGQAPTLEETDIEGVRYATKRLNSTGSLPVGYYGLLLEHGGHASESLVISAPVQAYEPTDGRGEKSWGVFLPLYALRSERSWSAGHFGDLEALIDWVTGLGGGMVATLPLLAAFLDEPF